MLIKKKKKKSESEVKRKERRKKCVAEKMWSDVSYTKKKQKKKAKISDENIWEKNINETKSK